MSRTGGGSRNDDAVADVESAGLLVVLVGASVGGVGVELEGGAVVGAVVVGGAVVGAVVVGGAVVGAEVVGGAVVGGVLGLPGLLGLTDGGADALLLALAGALADFLAEAGADAGADAEGDVNAFAAEPVATALGLVQDTE
jgi:hypothetical protein